MNIQIELWHLLTFLIGLLLTFLGFAFGIGRMMLSQVKAQLDERFKLQEANRAESSKHWDRKFAALEAAAGKDAAKWGSLERELLLLKAELPEKYVRREDHIRNQTVIEAKIDGLAVKLENAILKGNING